MVSCVKYFYILPLLKTLAGVVFQETTMQKSHGALGVCVNYKLLDKRGNGIPFPSCILVLFGGGGDGGRGGG